MKTNQKRINRLRRVLSLFLCVFLSLTIMPTMVFSAVTINLTDTTIVYTGEQIKFPDSCISIDGMSATDVVIYLYSSDISNGETPVFTENQYPTDCGTYRVYAMIKDKKGTKLADSGNATSFIIKPLSVTIEAATAEKPYDGTPLTDSTYILRSDLGIGDTLTEVIVSGTQTPVGSSPNKITKAVVMKGDRDVTKNYSLIFIDGMLTVTEKATAVSLKDKTVEYTGSPIAIEPATVTGSSAAPVYHYYNDNGLTNKLSGPPTDAGTYYVKATVAADPQYGAGENDPAATLTITPRNVTITADDAIKTYDGTPLTESDPRKAIATNLAPGHSLSLKTVISGTQTEVGENPNIFDSIVIKDADGNDVTKNYQFTPTGGTPGTLKVTPATPVVILTPKTETYDGNTVPVDPAEIITPEKGDKIDPADIVYKYYKDSGCTHPIDSEDPTTPPTDVGTYYVTATTPSSKNYYSATSEPVAIRINPRPVTITTGSKIELDVGTPLTYDHYTYTNDTLATGETLTDCDVTGVREGVGTSKNTVDKESIVIKNGEGIDVTKNYEVTIVEGDLTLYKAANTVVISGSKTLTGGGKTTTDITAGQFSFSISAGTSSVADGYSGFTAGSVKCATGGSFEFDAITFTKVGTYTFNITEDNLGAAGYTYDNRTILATVDVTFNAQAVSLETTITYTRGNNAVNAIIFEIFYTPTPVKSDFSAEKVVIGNPEAVSDFTFIFKANDKNFPMPEGSINEIKEVTINGAGGVAFGEITFTEVGTYVYTVTEKNTGVNNYTYDTTIYTLTYVVTDTNSNFDVGLTIKSDNKIVDNATFINSYKDPSDSSDPSEPSDPSEHGEPSEPSDSSDPSEPSESGDPSDPNNPGDPSNPADPSNPSNPNSPQTGDSRHSGFLIVLLALSAFGLYACGFIRKRQ